MQKNLNNKIIATLVISGMFLVPTAVMAKVEGACGSCHTMHNSQNGDPMATTFDYATGTVVDPTPNGSLLRFGCIGCHTGTNSASTTVPYVLDLNGAPLLTSLAGGNFYWVSGRTDNTGHNVYGVAGADIELGDTGPGGTSLGSQLTCANTSGSGNQVNGCHGASDATDEFGAIAGGHHGAGGTPINGNNHTYTSGDPTDMSDAFRMLSGVIGIEANDWEFGASTTDDGTINHNQYYGVARSTEADATTGSISSLCANCHGDFHGGGANVGAAGSFSSPWIRHPTDFDMALATGSEYAFYNGGDGTGTAPYSLIAPVASDSIAGNDTDILANVNVTSGTADGSAIVTCVSCHRAHGSPFADLLRWEYGTEDAHSGQTNTGCFVCHTTKDE